MLIKLASLDKRGPVSSGRRTSVCIYVACLMFGLGALTSHRLSELANRRRQANELDTHGDSISSRTSIRTKPARTRTTGVMFASAHVVLTRDDRGQNLVLTGEDGRNGNGNGKGGGGGGGGDQLVIAGSNMDGLGDGQSTNMIMQDASNREGDIVMSGRSMIIPGEDGHIVLADSRRQDGPGPRAMPMLADPFMFWASYMAGGQNMNRMFYGPLMPLLG